MKKLILLTSVVVTVGSLAAQTAENVILAGQLSYPMPLNDVWGYTDSLGNEYALVGAFNGLSVVDVTNPTTPTQEFFIPGTSTTWRDIKSWEHYAYVMHDAGSNPNGLLIVDLDSMENPHYKFMYPDMNAIGIADSATRSHNLWIDENGYLYIFGADVGLGGAIIMDVATDPWNPTVVGIYNGNYLHDGFVRGDTLWGAALTNGIVVVDVSLKNNPVLISQFTTPSNFAHNCWLSDDGNALFTTDEVSSAYIGAFDVSDLTNVSETDRIRLDPDDGTIPHNAHVKENLLFTSYYTYGLHITDISVPDWLIEVGQYDSSPLSGDGFNGAWGTYPFLPSGNVLISDIQEGLFVVTPSYTEAARIYGVVSDSISDSLLAGAVVYFKSDSDTIALDPLTAGFRRHTIGGFIDTVVITFPDYFPATIPVEYREGYLDTLKFKLLREDFAVGETEVNPISIRPNPSTGSFVIESSQAFSNAGIRIVNLTGRTVYEGRWEQQSMQTGLELNLPAGVYIAEVGSPEFTWTQRLVIQ